jgi:hypothetical protein
METKARRNRFEKKGPFPLGSLYITPGAQAAICDGGCDHASTGVREALTRHMRGDWGEVCDEDWKENDFSLENGFRILSAYKSKAGVTFWVITEADRSATTILLPEEY